MLVKIYDEEKTDFEIKNVEFKNITYTSYMPSKIEGNSSNTNTVQVSLKDINANGIDVKKENALLSVGDYCDVSFE